MIISDQILDTLRAVGKNGLSIKELETRLKIGSKSIIEILEQLMAKGLVMQKQDSEDIKYLIHNETSEGTTPTRSSDFNGCPCFHCPKISRCGVRQTDSPLICRSLDEWIASGISS